MKSLLVVMFALSSCAASEPTDRPMVTGGVIHSDAKPKLISGNKQPRLPPAVVHKMRGTKGIVTVRLLVDGEGNVAKAEILRNALIPEIGAAVLATVNDWKFEAWGRDSEIVQPFMFAF